MIANFFNDNRELYDDDEEVNDEYFSDVFSGGGINGYECSYGGADIDVVDMTVNGKDCRFIFAKDYDGECNISCYTLNSEQLKELHERLANEDDRLSFDEMYEPYYCCSFEGVHEVLSYFLQDKYHDWKQHMFNPDYKEPETNSAADLDEDELAFWGAFWDTLYEYLEERDYLTSMSDEEVEEAVEAFGDVNVTADDIMHCQEMVELIQWEAEDRGFQLDEDYFG